MMSQNYHLCYPTEDALDNTIRITAQLYQCVLSETRIRTRAISKWNVSGVVP